MLRYFNVDTDTARIIYITNEDEREHLGGFVPIEQIGTYTVSSAYVKPTAKGGIRVKTANLNWVTSNMIATALSTSGVVNCEVVAAAPFEVSGTGALTGVMMAYEEASGETLDETRKELATEEIVVTGNLAQDVGRKDATAIINEAKMQIIEGNVQQAEEIYNIVINLVQKNNLDISEDQLNEIISLLQQIAQQNYDYNDMKDTLERVDENTNGNPEDETFPEEDETPADEVFPESPEDETFPEDEEDILDNLDEGALGDDVISDSTEEPAEDDVPEIPEEEWPEDDWNDGNEIIVDDPLPGVDEEVPGEEFPEEVPGEVPGEELPEEVPDDGSEDAGLTPDNLDEALRELYDKAELFAEAVYEGNQESLNTLIQSGDMDELTELSVVLDEETAGKLKDAVLKAYLEVLNEDAESYIPQDGDLYLVSEMNMLDRVLKPIFGQDEMAAEEDILAAVDPLQKETLYQETLRFFGKLYGEDSMMEEMPEETMDENLEETLDEEVPADVPMDEVPAEETMDEVPAV